MENKITYAEYKKRFRDYQDGWRNGKALPKPSLRDVDLDTVEPEKRGLVAEMMEQEPK